MADGKVHAQDSRVLAVAAGVGGTLVFQNFVAGAFVALGALSGIYITPDLDVDGWIHSKRAIVNAHAVFGYLWFGFWFPYSRAIKHRHWLSHAPIVSTLIRVAYIGAIPFAVLYVTKTAVPDIAQAAFVLWVIGLMVSDVAHWARDGFPI